MEITRTPLEGWMELTIAGRLDGYWADHLDRGLTETVREGHNRLRLNLTSVTFLSSAGVGVLVKFYKRLAAIKGALVIASASDAVRMVLDMTRLSGVLIDETAVAPETYIGRALVRGHALLQVFELETRAQLSCEIADSTSLFEPRGEARSPSESGADRARSPSAPVATTLRCPTSRFALGIGAFGANDEECRGRFGEFIAVAGAAAYLPADGTEVADYLVASDAHAPELRVLRSIACEGPFAYQVRFETTRADAVVPLSDLAAAALEISGSNTAGLVIIAETTGLVGASLRRSPLASDTADFFAFPDVRARLTFTAERAFARSLALVVGVVQRPGGILPAGDLRPVDGDTSLLGHFHAGAFPFHPFKKGRLDLRETVETLFEGGGLQSVLHLINDDRQISGIGQSEFTRGACWIGPIQNAGRPR